MVDDENADRLGPVAHRNLLTAHAGEIKFRVPGHRVRLHKLAIELLGLVLQPACGVDRIAIGCQIRGQAAAQVPDDRRSTMNADTKLERHGQFFVQVGAALFDPALGLRRQSGSARNGQRLFGPVATRSWLGSALSARDSSIGPDARAAGHGPMLTYRRFTLHGESVSSVHQPIAWPSCQTAEL